MKRKLTDSVRHLFTAVRDFRHVASLFPSSRYAIRSVLKQISVDSEIAIEYGPGTGVFTHALLKHLAPSSHLYCIEINPGFIAQLRKTKDPRLTLVEGSVLAVLPSVRARCPQGADVVLSGIPFTVIPSDERERIVEETRKALRSGGKFIIYQNSRLMVSLFRKYFASVTVKFEPRNVFPYFIITGNVD